METLPGAHPQYAEVTLEQLVAHTSGMHYNPLTEPGDQWFPADLSIGLTDANVMERRVKFVHAAVLDVPLFAPGDGFTYGGGAIVAAAMFERRTGVRFERLMQTHLFAPLNMDHSGLGVTSPGPLDGPWLHAWSGAHVPHDGAHLPQAGYHSHGVVGNYVMSAPDMGRFLRENLTAAPQTMSAATRNSVHSKMVSPKSNTSRGGWNVWNPAQPDSTAISHNGDDAHSMHADMVLHRASGWGMAAGSNCYNLFAQPAVHDMHNIMKTMVTKWSALFGNPDAPLPESVHPTAALVWADPDHRWLFARRTSGALMRRRLPLEGAPETAIDFPGGVFTSGVAAATSGEHVEVMGRGTDNQIWRGWSKDSGATWQGFKPIPNGTFMTGPPSLCPPMAPPFTSSRSAWTSACMCPAPKMAATAGPRGHRSEPESSILSRRWCAAATDESCTRSGAAWTTGSGPIPRRTSAKTGRRTGRRSATGSSPAVPRPRATAQRARYTSSGVAPIVPIGAISSRAPGCPTGSRFLVLTSRPPPRCLRLSTATRWKSSASTAIGARAATDRPMPVHR